MSEHPTFRDYLTEWFDDEIVDTILDEMHERGFRVVHIDEDRTNAA